MHIKHNILKKIFILFILFLSVNIFAEVSLSIYPTPIIAGEESSLIINSNEGKAKINKLPEVEGMQWIKTNSYSQNIMIVNGVKYIKTSYPFIVKKSGKLKLPSMKITLENEKEISTAPKELLVSTGPLSDLESLLFIRCEYPENKKTYYIGEDIPLKINVFRALDLDADPGEYPQIKMDNVVFDEFKDNKQTKKFAPYPYGSPAKASEDGIDYIKTAFYTSFRPLRAGELKGGVSITFAIQLKNNQSKKSSPFGEDDFFASSLFSDSFFNRGKIVSRIINAETPAITILPLPPVPEGTTYLGLVGNWDIKEKINYDKLKEGEPITVSMELTGFGSTENLTVPEIIVPGFNTYPPEVINNSKKNNNKQYVKIDYVLIPTEPGKNNLNLSFSYFDTESEKYKTLNISKNFNIQKGDGESIKSNYSPEITERPVKKENRVSSSILYIKINPGISVELPLYRNHLFTLALLSILGPLFWILFEMFRFRKKYITGKEGFKRKSKAMKKKGFIIKALKQTQNMKELSNTVQKDVVPFINDVKGFPPGTTVKDLEKMLNKKDITKALSDCEEAAYMPSDEGEAEELKSKIIKIVKRFSIFILICSLTIMVSNNMFGNEKSEIAEFTELYNSGNFDEALNICKEQNNFSMPNPNWLYNLGNCYFQKGDLAKTMVCYERALRLSPRDSDILENLNFVRRKLFLPEAYQTKNPIELICFIRDYLRPDEWLLIFFSGWFLIFITLIIRRLTPTKIWLILCIFSIFACALSGTAYLTEKSSRYNKRDAVIIERNVKVFSLPTKDSSDAGFTLNSGDSVRIEENVQNWIRVRKNKSEGWIDQNKAEQIWPY